MLSAQCLWHSLPKGDIGDPAAREVDKKGSKIMGEVAPHWREAGQKGLEDNGEQLHHSLENSHDRIIDLVRLSFLQLLLN